MTKKTQGRPKDLQKGTAILDAATHIFLERGFAATSMDAVAQRSGVSKQTLYSHFGGKDELFKQVIKTKVDHYGSAGLDTSLSGNLLQDLRLLGERVVGLLLDDEAVAMMRVVISESRQQPKVAGLFFQMGPQRITGLVRDNLQSQQERGLIPAGDVEELAILFINMLKGSWYMSSLMGIRPEFPRSEQTRFIAITVERFLRLLETERCGE